MNLLILGGGGFLGINTVRSLIKMNYVIHVLDRNINNLMFLNFPNVFFHIGLLNNTFLIEHLIKAHDINCIINMASGIIPSSNFELFSSDLSSNISPSVMLLKRIADLDILYIYISSGGTIYGEHNQNKLTEETFCKPISLYGFSKLIFENSILFAHQEFDLQYLILRPSNPYGFFQNPSKNQGFIPISIRKIINNEPIEIYGDGSTIRDYIWVEDLTDLIAKLIHSKIKNEIFNLGSGIGYNLNYIINVLKNISGCNIKVNFLPWRINDIRYVVLDTCKIRSRFNFTLTTLDDGIAKLFRGIDRD
jgi:UDP-glucose 4-epimerase